METEISPRKVPMMAALWGLVTLVPTLVEEY